jgi:hypothetical protein
MKKLFLMMMLLVGVASCTNVVPHITYSLPEGFENYHYVPDTSTTRWVSEGIWSRNDWQSVSKPDTLIVSVYKEPYCQYEGKEVELIAPELFAISFQADNIDYWCARYRNSRDTLVLVINGEGFVRYERIKN